MGQPFLADLARATQALSDAREVMTTTARLLAEHLGVDRCAYAEIEDEKIFVITGDYSRGVASIVGRWPVAAFGAECERLMLANQPYVINDVDLDPRAGPELIAYRQTNIAAVICVPLHKDSKFAAAMAVHQRVARMWTPAEIELVRTVVARSWESIERTRVTSRLRETGDRLSLAIAAANMGDWSWNSATDVVSLSTRAETMFGLPPGTRITWVQMQELIHPDDREHARLEFERAVAVGGKYESEYRVDRSGGDTVWVAATGRLQYENGQSAGMYGVFQDITDRKTLERELRQRAEKLAAADRQKDDFIALLAHELRNPLAPLRNGLQVMRLAAGNEKVVANARTIMDRQLSHMVRLIDDLLDISRLNRDKLHLQKQKVLLSDAVNHAVETITPAIEAARHHLTVTLPSAPVALDADLTRLAQLFGNLLSNAAKYTLAGGNIWLSAQVDGSRVVVTVKDTGIGIPAASLPDIFDMFSQVDRSIERSSGGLGMGLALVKGLVEAHGGEVSVTSDGIGQGSTFTVCLPTAEPFSVVPPESAAQADQPLNAEKKIVVVDDNEDGAAALADMLRLLGHDVHIAHDGLEAVQTAERVRPDLVLMDLGMPKLNGLDATRQIRATVWGKGMTIVALTGWGQQSDRELSRAAGCNGHLVKPVAMTDLQKLIATNFS